MSFSRPPKKKKPNSHQRQLKREAKTKRLTTLRAIERPRFSDFNGDGLMDVPTLEAIEGYTAMMARKKAIQEAAIHLAMAKRARRQARNMALYSHTTDIMGAKG